MTDDKAIEAALRVWRDPPSHDDRLIMRAALAEADKVRRADGFDFEREALALTGDDVWPKQILLSLRRAFAAGLAKGDAKIAALVEALEATEWWAKQRCPCENEEPNPCPLCGANVDNPRDSCKAVEETFPRNVLTKIRDALALVRKGV